MSCSLVASRLEAAPGEIGAPAKAVDDGLKKSLGGQPRSGLRADAVEQDDLAAGTHHPGKLLHRFFRVGHRVDPALRGHHVKGGRRVVQPLAIHDREVLHVAQVFSGDPRAGFSQHLLGQVDPGDTVPARIKGEG